MPLYDRDYMRPDNRPGRPPWFVRWTVLHWIIATNVAVFCLQHLMPGMLTTALPDGRTVELGGVSIKALQDWQIWTLFTYMFVHANLLHLVGNMLLIGFVGARVLALLGVRPFMLIYFLSGLVGAAAQLIVQGSVQGAADVPIIGASACGFGLFLAFAALLPSERVTTMIYFIIPVTARLWTLALVLVGVELVLGVSALTWDAARSLWGGLAYFAHLGGAFTGWYFVRLLGYGGNPMTYERLWRERRLTQRTPVKRAVARVRRDRATPEIDSESTRRRRTEPGRPEHPAMEEVNAILDKMNRNGISSLSEDDRRVLDRASRELGQREASGDRQ